MLNGHQHGRGVVGRDRGPPRRRRSPSVNSATAVVVVAAAACCLASGLLYVLIRAFAASVPPLGDADGTGVAVVVAPPPPDYARTHAPLRNNDEHENGASRKQEKQRQEKKKKKKKQGRRKHRLAVVIPYLPPPDGAPTFPPYFDLFVTSAGGSSEVVDFLIFHCSIPTSLLPDDGDLPSNVHLIDLNRPTGAADDDGEASSSSQCGLSDLFMRVTDDRRMKNEMEVSPSELSRMISLQMKRFPYILVEFKPAFGHIFADYLDPEEYTHWGYSDLDVAWGDLTRWITDDEWTEYDVVTYGFGDQEKIYLRGQFTFHRNDPAKINQLWRGCKYLSEMDIRYSDSYVKGTKGFKFESAEGCYSRAVVTRKDIRVKYAVKASTDVDVDAPVYAQGMYLSLGSRRDRSVLYTSSSESGRAPSSLSPTWFEEKGNPYNNHDRPLQREVGERVPIETHRTKNQLDGNDAAAASADVRCMYWAPKEYQMDLCAVDGSVEPDDTVFLIDGELYRQKHTTEGSFPDGVASLPLFHFQEWKRTYRLTQVLTSKNIRQLSGAGGLIFAKEGVLPLEPTVPSSSVATSRAWLIRPEWSLASSHSDGTTGDTGASPKKNRGRPSSFRYYCLKSSTKKHPPGATACLTAASWSWPGGRKGEGSAEVTIIRSPTTASAGSPLLSSVRRRKHEKDDSSWWGDRSIDADTDVTLVLTLQLTMSEAENEGTFNGFLAVADSNLFAWGGRHPKVLLIHVGLVNGEQGDDATRSSGDGADNPAAGAAVRRIRDYFDKNRSESAYLENTLIAAVVSDGGGRTVSRKALLNMAADVAPTRWIVSGLEVERGLVFSSDASIYATRAARVHANLPGHVFALPQFASVRDVAEEDGGNRPPEGLFATLSSKALPNVKLTTSVTSRLEEYDCSPCSEGDDDNTNDMESNDEGGKGKENKVLNKTSTKSVDEQLEEFWWDLSVTDVYGTPGGYNGRSESSLDAIAKIHDRLEVSLLSLLDNDSRDCLRRGHDKFPVLMIDRLGPRDGMFTLNLIPEVEELGGWLRCFDLLRLAQMSLLDYKVSVLPGAFAVSFPRTRSAVCDIDSIRPRSSLLSSKCGCDLGDEVALGAILADERGRSAKMAVLLHEMDAKTAR